MGGVHAGIANDDLSPVLEDATRTTDFLTSSEECQTELRCVCHLLQEIPDGEASNVHHSSLNCNQNPHPTTSFRSASSDFQGILFSAWTWLHSFRIPEMFSTLCRLPRTSVPPAVLSLRTRIAQASFRLYPWVNNLRKMATTTEFKQVFSFLSGRARCTHYTRARRSLTSQYRTLLYLFGLSLTIGQAARYTGPDRSSR